MSFNTLTECEALTLEIVSSHLFALEHLARTAEIEGHHAQAKAVTQTAREIELLRAKLRSAFDTLFDTHLEQERAGRISAMTSKTYREVGLPEFTSLRKAK